MLSWGNPTNPDFTQLLYLKKKASAKYERELGEDSSGKIMKMKKEPSLGEEEEMSYYYVVAIFCLQIQ